MTTTTAIYTIPAEGLRHEAGAVVIVAFQTPQAGILIQGRVNGTIASEMCSRHDFESNAIRAYTALVEQYPTEVEPTTEPTVKLAPAAKGTTQNVSDPGHIVLMLAASDPHGIVQQGGGEGQATRTQLRALARRFYLELIYEDRTDSRKVPIAGRITLDGLARLAELDAADAYRARIEAAIAGPARTNATIAA